MTIDIEKLIQDIDEDGSGEIEYDEFRNLLSSSDWIQLLHFENVQVYITNVLMTSPTQVGETYSRLFVSLKIASVNILFGIEYELSFKSICTYHYKIY